MLRRFAHLMIIACLVLAFLSVSVAQKVTSDPCAELSSSYSGPFHATVPHALNLKMYSCDFMIQFYDAEDALINHMAPGGSCEGGSLGRLRARHGISMLQRIETATQQPSTLTLRPALKP
jgi:hypothetical protein